MPIILAANCWLPDGAPRVPGQWQLRMVQWWSNIRGPMLVFGCPRGRGTCGVPIAPSPKNSNDAVWTWDGNLLRPTLSPSINCIALDKTTRQILPGVGCAWHGHMTNGVLA